MRISNIEGDPGFNAWFPIGIEIRLNGAKCGDVVMADEERGEILRAARNERGELYTVGDEIAMETVHGKVEVIVPDGVSRDPYHWIEPLWTLLARLIRRQILRWQMREFEWSGRICG